MESKQEKENLYNISRKIFVGNISYRVRSKRLGQFFSKFGAVESSYVVRDHIRKWSRGIGFVTFDSEESVKRALAAKEEELKFDNRKMRVKPAELSSRTTYWQEGEEQNGIVDDDDDAAAAVDATHTACDEHSNNHSMDVCRDSIQDGDDSRQSMNEVGTHIHALFDEILVKIFTLLSVKERLAIERVCWRWKHVVQQSWSCLRELHVRNMFRGFDGLTDKRLNTLLLRCGQYLETLDLSASPRSLTDFTMDIIGKHCPGLTSLDLTCVKITDLSVLNMASKCHKLQHVRFRKCLHLTDKGIHNLCSSCPNLLHLDLSDLPGIQGQHCFDHVANSLLSLNLSDCHQVTDRAIQVLSKRCPQLEEINLSRCRTLTDPALDAICENLHGLKKFTLEGIKASDEALAKLEHLINLEDLNLSFVYHANNLTVEAIVRGCQKLRCLNLSGCSLTDGGVIALSRLPHLTSLNISYMYSQVTQESVFQLAEAGRLQQFVARTSACATDEAVVSLATFCPDLVLCDVSGCFQVTNAIFEGFKQARTGDQEKTIELYLGGTSVDWIADDVDWMSGFSHLQVSMNNLAIRELQPEQDIILPDVTLSDDEDNEEEEDDYYQDFDEDYIENLDLDNDDSLCYFDYPT